MAFLAALLLIQQAQTAQRTEKGDYYPVVQKCKDGEALIDSDPRGAIDKFDEVITNAKIKRMECYPRIEERPSEYTGWYAFLPYQYRGRGKIALARKSEPDVGARGIFARPRYW